MQISLTVEVPIGHRLPAHQGKCKNYHGHNYRVTVRISGAVGADTGMVMDFSDLKRELKTILDPFDHAMVLEDGDELIPFLRERAMKYIIFEMPPTAENFARHWRSRLVDRLYWDLEKVSVTVQETSDSEATT